ncbi:hypothetical protein [Bergeyella zoohelcum]|uniref:hypothetical protein n=1 Tax=Bergeyella zoohelcum TaxID=1015 RepID=UPI00373668FD
MQKKEQTEAELLINKGFTIDISFGKRKKSVYIRPLTLETMLHCNHIAVQIQDNFKSENTIGDYLATMNDEIKLKSEFVACAYLHSDWKIKLFKKIVAYWFRKQLTSETITKLVYAILEMYNLENFTPSTRLIMQSRITAPKTNRVE